MAKLVNNPMRVGDIRAHNEKIILQSIFKSGMVGRSQSEVVASTGLRPPTVLRFFLKLEENGYIVNLTSENISTEIKQTIKDIDPQSHTKGRPPVRYIVNKDKIHTVGIEFWSEGISIGVFDFQQNRIYNHTQSITKKITADVLSEMLAQLIKMSVNESRIDPDSVIGIGIGAPGKIAINSGTIVYYPRIEGMKDYPLAAILTKKTGFNITIHNNCSVLALAESRYGKAKKNKSVFVFLFRTGVNGAFVANGNLYVTSQGTTIETGHLPVTLDGPQCECGRRGCLEAWMLQNNNKISNSVGSQDLQLLMFESLREGIEAKDPQAIETLRTSVRYLFSAIRMINNFLKPEAFVFTAMSQSIADVISELVQEIEQTQPGAFDPEKVSYYSNTYSPLVTLRGASELVFDDFFK